MTGAVKTKDELRSAFERWARREDWSAWLIVGALVVEAFVVWEFADSKSLCETISLIVVDLAIAAGVYGEIHFSNKGKAAAAELQRISDEKVAAADAMAEAARTEAAKASDGAAAANLKAESLRKQNLELERALSPRILEQNLTAQQLASFSDVAFLVISPSDFEPRRTAGQIRFMLAQAGWKRFTDAYTADGVFFDGVIVHAIVGAISPRPGEAADALVVVLNDNGIVAKRGYPIRELGSSAILVVVGPKPLPISD